MTAAIWSLPEVLSGLFIEAYEGGYLTKIYSAVDAAEIERVLREHGISYQTKIIRSRRRGVIYQIAIMEGAYEHS
jgi:hypothetical protein